MVVISERRKVAGECIEARTISLLRTLLLNTNSSNGLVAEMFLLNRESWVSE